MEQAWILGLIGGLMIGTAAALLLLVNGKVAGISGILGSALEGREMGQSAPFLAGMVGAAALYALLTGGPGITVTGSVPILMIGGLLVGFGTRLGSGCTSGHGVCGISRLSLRSLAATGVFMGAAAAVVFVMRHLLGGA